MRMENFNRPEKSIKRQQVINLTSFNNKMFIGKYCVRCVRFLIIGNARKDKFANNFIFIKYLFSQVKFLFAFLDGQERKNDINY